MNMRPLKTAVLAITAAMGLCLTPGVANAAPGNLVSFGDSIMANPTLEAEAQSRIDPNANPCPTDPWGFAKHAAWNMGLEPQDYSCAGATVFGGENRFDKEVDRAIADGALGPDTRVVLVNIGFNNTYGPLMSGVTENDIRNYVVDGASAQVERIRAAAPQAKIKIVGYSSITDDHHTCLAQMGNNIHSREFFDFITYIEWLSDDMLRNVADRTHTQFVDLKPASVGHSMCAPDGERWFGGLIDLGQHRNMPVHMTALGNERVGQIIAQS
ncbi:hydrolase [Corynebacterium poyangense]|uniref:Hydrolase n=1 Tax=Corynebacterium poyangense TaxID=2684405 RepID=A0A7H0SNX8_9CORY|nr:GDSL-type esterase/lipase family protein [Corynebacterium poyangense]MBZ8177814.1 hydrolase [Corynebacterium poyangense]QNQ90253.1 hydrolase [Corynebacterium poyangense]